MRSQLPRVAAPISIPLLCVALLIAAICSGCGQVDRTLLTGDPCEPPCWQGLTPGVSTAQQVEHFLGASQYVKPDSVHREAWGWRDLTTISWESTAWWIGKAEPNALIVQGDTLMVISIQLDYELTLEDLLDRYGPPQRYWARWRGWGGADVIVNLYYPTTGLVTKLVVESSPSDGHHRLEPDSLVTRVWYCPSTSLDGLADLGDLIPLPPREYMDTDLNDWGGYGAIEVI